MTSTEQRKTVRINSLNLSYIGIDENNVTVKQAMGRTLNVSANGILMETHFPIDSKQMVSLSLALEDDLINLKGEVVYSRPGENDRYETGIKFIEVDEASQLTLKKYIQAFKK
jgi:c-di-GMP-binding flagellar brake protein YcgR